VPVVGKISEEVQIDHTVIDVIVVNERAWNPIGRPFLTAAIDMSS
jgi:putative transposase